MYVNLIPLSEALQRHAELLLIVPNNGISETPIESNQHKREIQLSFYKSV